MWGGCLPIHPVHILKGNVNLIVKERTMWDIKILRVLFAGVDGRQFSFSMYIIGLLVKPFQMHSWTSHSRPDQNTQTRSTLCQQSIRRLPYHASSVGWLSHLSLKWPYTKKTDLLRENSCVVYSIFSLFLRGLEERKWHKGKPQQSVEIVAQNECGDV